MNSPLFLAAQEARRLVESYGLDGEEAQITAESETRLPDVIARLIEAEVADEAAIEACKARAQELRLRAERIQARIDRRREAIADAISDAGLKKLDCGSCTVSTKLVPASYQIDDKLVPERFQREVVTKKADRPAILKAIDSGEDVPGVSLRNGRATIVIRRT